MRGRGFAGYRICHLLSVCQDSKTGEDPTAAESDGAGRANKEQNAGGTL